MDNPGSLEFRKLVNAYEKGRYSQPGLWNNQAFNAATQNQQQNQAALIGLYDLRKSLSDAPRARASLEKEKPFECDYSLSEKTRDYKKWSL